ncbi:hypothetical protein H4R20_002943 [Coemansia guatemalensis]|uniref:Ankyrin n=1 Tax=Coemansia guatemalensis TaxID=2761395 RepID=A0A9W8HWY7_9FUNG|nr:hypothetical protein H4R20_002943 [Coemansia guatemalensis]
MERDSEVETVLADEEWLGLLSENTQRNRTRRHDTSIESSCDSFDEEVLFSSSGSLSSLHEFSDEEAGGASSESDSGSANSNHSGPIIRNGTTPLDEGDSDGERHSVALSTALTESELDVEANGTRHPSEHSKKKKPARNAQRRRKVISEDEDDGDGEQSDAVDGGNGRSAALPGHGSQPLQDVRNKPATIEASELAALKRTTKPGTNGDGASEAAKLKQLGKRELGDAASSPRKHRTIKRRKVHYGNPDYVDDNGCPQLVYFASRGDAATCRKLLLRGASISAADTHGWTSVHEAAKHGHIETLELLLDPPARARQQQREESSDSNGLDMADSRLVRQLRSLFPDVNATTLHSHQTPLHQAVASDNIAAVRLLLDHGALTSIANSRQLTPLDTCSNENIARLLTDRAKTQRNVAIRDKAGQTKLHRACNAGDLEQVVALINQGAGINVKDNAGWTPLHEAALEGRNIVVVALLRHNADFAARGFGGDTPLHDACANGHVDVVRSLLIAGADATLKNSKGITPEAMAREEEHNEVLQAIEEYRQSGLCAPLRISDSGSGQRTSGGSSSSVGKGKRPASTKSADAAIAKESSTQGRSRATSPAARAVERASSLQSRKARDKQSKAMQSRRLDSHDQDASSTSSSKRELVSLKRLREEAEKPMVNYYFSSTSSKLSRDERKLQVLMGTIERMEKRRPKDRRRASAESTESLHDEPAELSVDSTDPHKASAMQGELKDEDLAPKRRRGRPSKKRAADDGDNNDEQENEEMKGAAEAITRKANQKQRLGAKRPKYGTDEQTASAEAGAEASYAQHGVVTIDGSGGAVDSRASRTPPPRSTLFGEVSAAAAPTVAIKTEPVVASGEHALVRSPSPAVVTSAQPAQSRISRTSNRKPAVRSSAAGGRRNKARQNVEVGGRTIVEDAPRTQKTGTLTPEAIAARAIRYLPLYTIQLHSDPPTSKLDYFVVDLQIRLLLGMSIDTPSEDAAGEDDAACNPLFQRYTHLCRQRITESQKEHLWEPLASMFVSNIQLIHDSTAALAEGRAATESADGKAPKSKTKKASGGLTAAADKELVSKFTLHERSRFVALDLYFVKLDEVVKIIRQDYPQISKQLITITLDLSSIGLADVAMASNTMAVTPSPLTAPAKSRPRLVADITKEAEAAQRRPVWTGPQKMLPLRYALKLHYRDHLQFLKHNADNH